MDLKLEIFGTRGCASFEEHKKIRFHFCGDQRISCACQIGTNELILPEPMRSEAATMSRFV